MSTGPNMATITAALERSLQNCSLNHSQHNHHHHHHQQMSSGDFVHGGGIGSSSSSDEISEKNHHRHHLPMPNSADTTLELNSHLSLPYHWEQCLDLKTGEIYYINWRNGMKAKEDPRSTNGYNNEDYYSDEDDDDDSSYDSEESSTESSTFTSSRDQHKNYNNNNNNHRVEEEEEEEEEEKEDHVLVVAGCKSCLMYFMVPKHLEDCPKCTGQLLHFDRSENDIP